MGFGVGRLCARLWWGWADPVGGGFVVLVFATRVYLCLGRVGRLQGFCVLGFCVWLVVGCIRFLCFVLAGGGFGRFVFVMCV